MMTPDGIAELRQRAERAEAACAAAQRHISDCHEKINAGQAALDEIERLRKALTEIAARKCCGKHGACGAADVSADTAAVALAGKEKP